MPTVAVTPMANTYRLKKVPSVDSKNIKTDKSFQDYAVISSNMGDDPLKLSVMQHQHSNGACFGVAGSLSNVKILTKSKDSREKDGPSVQSGVQLAVGNGVTLDRTSMNNAQNSGLTNGRPVSNFASKQQARFAVLSQSVMITLSIEILLICFYDRAIGAVNHSRR
ncbi:hypothetical protein AHAS_Ahas19G0209200 [Arachis hypogaea]